MLAANLKPSNVTKVTLEWSLFGFTTWPFQYFLLLQVFIFWDSHFPRDFYLNVVGSIAQDNCSWTPGWRIFLLALWKALSTKQSRGNLKIIICWAFQNLLTHRVKIQINGTLLSKWRIFSDYEIWPQTQFFNLKTAGDWDVKNNSDELFARTPFGPVTDFQWNGELKLN